MESMGNPQSHVFCAKPNICKGKRFDGVHPETVDIGSGQGRSECEIADVAVTP
jgi:hypothetical protein